MSIKAQNLLNLVEMFPLLCEQDGSAQEQPADYLQSVLSCSLRELSNSYVSQLRRKIFLIKLDQRQKGHGSFA
jgi:hypothetical protein